MGKNLGDLRSLLQDHFDNDAGLMVDVSVCLQQWLVDDYNAAIRRKGEIAKPAEGSMAGIPTDDIDAELEQLIEKMDAASVILHFKVLNDSEYRDVLRDHPESGDSKNSAAFADFQVDVAKRMYRGCTFDGERIAAAEMPFSEWQTKLGGNEINPVVQEAWLKQRLPTDDPRPFSSAPSRKKGSSQS